MGNFLKSNSINPEKQISRRRKSLMNLTNKTRQVSRTNFKYISKFSTTGVNSQSITWIAQNIDDPEQRFFIKQSDKQKAYNHKRIEALKTQMMLLTQEDIPFLNPCIYAFQDSQYLYMVSEYIQGYTLQQTIRQHSFTQQQTKHVILVLINIIDSLHKKGYLISELSPRNFIIDKKKCSIKMIELINPLKMDQYYPSEVITQTSLYAAPEVLVMDKINGEADFYSLGLIMYEMVTQKPAIKSLLTSFGFQGNQGKSNQKIMSGQDRTAILNQQIIVTKSDLPEGWSPQAIDILIKLIIKNPLLRLGRYGSFEVRNHQWLHNSSNWENFNDSLRANLKTGNTNRKHRKQSQTVNNYAISLVQEYFQQSRQIKNNLNREKCDLCINGKFSVNFSFQLLFQDYEYKRSFQDIYTRALMYNDSESIIEDDASES